MICNVLRNSPASNFHIHLRFGNFLSIEKCDGIGNNTIRLKYTNEKLQLLLYVCAMLRRLERSKKKENKKKKEKEKISKAIEERMGHGIEWKEAM